ncbi:hypothetical protein RRG08_064289 [Elysia crispata]|uniref:Mediator of RNA polymerase II transcription subunit 15 n=1 Tax=Elysia crispata TaxID=231223 RepID=A0AAE0YSC0_9GAST|nr:hypothetical protein RRG08_064289 [Elysia crispata]
MTSRYRSAQGFEGTVTVAASAASETVRSETHPNINSEDKVEKFLASHSSKELEEFIFGKSKTREDYVGLMAEMLMMLRQHAGKPSDSHFS